MQTIRQEKKRFHYVILLFVLSISFSLNSCYPDIEEPKNETVLIDCIFPEADLFDTKAYRNNSVYASIIENSIMIDGYYCSFGELPLIGMETESPTVDDIMNRLVVSHDWMGERFQEVLETYPSDFLKLFRSVTAIVIDDDIRPSHYHVYTSTIYLDANFFWLSEAEKESINPKLDYRSDYSNDLMFYRFYRYVVNNEMAYRYSPPDSDYWPRKLEDIRLLIAKLLLHELAHANDFFPPKLYNSMSRSEKPWSVAYAHKELWISERLNKDNPLSSETLKDIAKVSFHGETATDSQKIITATNIGSVFEHDGASDYYSYSNIKEDVAMLFEEAMMKYFFDVDRDMAFVDKINGKYDDIIRWGKRNRFADPHVISRVEFVIKEMFPNINFENFIQTLPPAHSLTIGTDWWESLENFSSNSKSSNLKENKIENFHEPAIEYYIPYH